MEVWKIDGLEPIEVLACAVIWQAVEDYRMLEEWDRRFLYATDIRETRIWGTLVSYGRDAKNFLFNGRLDRFLNQYHLNLNPEYIRRKANARQGS